MEQTNEDRQELYRMHKVMKRTLNQQGMVLGVSGSTVRNWEIGKTIMPPAVLELVRGSIQSQGHKQ
jgi:hypothetical protein